MGIVSTILGFVGFGWGIGVGLAIGYFLFIYFQPVDEKVMWVLLTAFCLLSGMGGEFVGIA